MFEDLHLDPLSVSNYLFKKQVEICLNLIIKVCSWHDGNPLLSNKTRISPFFKWRPEKSLHLIQLNVSSYFVLALK